MNKQPSAAKVHENREREDYTMEDARRDLKLSSATTFSFTSKMDLRIDKSKGVPAKTGKD
jgi:hypothetical protein